jgi:hypothetical protein
MIELPFQPKKFGEFPISMISQKVIKKLTSPEPGALFFYPKSRSSYRTGQGGTPIPQVDFLRRH